VGVFENGVCPEKVGNIMAVDLGVLGYTLFPSISPPTRNKKHTTFGGKEPFTLLMGNTTPVNSHQEVLDSCFAGACRGFKKKNPYCADTC
jgi:hypothetical protein